MTGSESGWRASNIAVERTLARLRSPRRWADRIGSHYPRRRQATLDAVIASKVETSEPGRGAFFLALLPQTGETTRHRVRKRILSDPCCRGNLGANMLKPRSHPTKPSGFARMFRSWFHLRKRAARTQIRRRSIKRSTHFVRLWSRPKDG
jgi:hypothetical protein